MRCPVPFSTSLKPRNTDQDSTSSTQLKMVSPTFSSPSTIHIPSFPDSSGQVNSKPGARRDVELGPAAEPTRLPGPNPFPFRTHIRLPQPQFVRSWFAKKPTTSTVPELGETSASITHLPAPQESHRHAHAPLFNSYSALNERQPVDLADLSSPTEANESQARVRTPILRESD